MADTEKLKSMLDNIINDKQEDAQVDFHSYVTDKMKEINSGVQGVEDNSGVENKNTNEE